MDKIKLKTDLSTRLRAAPTDEVQKEAATHIDLLEQWAFQISVQIDKLTEMNFPSAETPAAKELRTIIGALHHYADHAPLLTKSARHIQQDLRAILGEPHVHKRSIGSDRCDLCERDLRDRAHERV